MADKPKARVKIDTKTLQAFSEKVGKIRNPFSKDEADKLGKAVVEEMKDMISKGTSPIAGYGRFPGYLHAGEKGKYPEKARRDYPSKRSRPVNLYLSGDQMRSLTSKPFARGKGWGVEVGYWDSLSKKKEEGHRVGVNGQPSRPTIPQAGERFAQRILTICYEHLRNSILRTVKGK
jgi:hypothetical protein